MKLSEQLRRDHESGDFGKSLEGYSARAKELEHIVELVAHIGVDFGYGAFVLSNEHIEKARKLLADPTDDRYPSHEPQSAPARSPQDYAIEHAEYMAVDGEQLLSYLNSIADEDEGTLMPDDQFSDHISGLRSGIYEFRKRRDRCQHGVQDSGVVDHD